MADEPSGVTSFPSSQNTFIGGGMPGYQTGQPILDMVLNMLMGQHLAPRPEPGSNQSIYDAALLRQRSRDMLSTANTALFQNIIAQRFGGVNEGGWAAGGAAMANWMTGQGNPADGIIARGLAPLTGGNVVQGQMNLFAGLTGLTMAQWGGPRNIGMNDSFAVRQAMDANLLRPITDSRGRVNQIYDYNRSFGFGVEDVTQGFTTAAGFRLFGRGAASPEVAMRAFSSAGGMGAFDAMRTTLGGSTGKEVLENFQALAGRSSVDLSSSADQEKVQTLLRDFKAAARVAGTSIDAVKGIVQEAQQLAASHPGLRGLGGLEITRMSTTALTNTSVLASAMGSDWVRRNGGTGAIFQNELGGAMQATTEGGSSRLSALAFLGKGNSRIQGMIKSFIGAGDFSNAAYRSLTQSAAGVLGDTSTNIAFMMGSQAYAERGGLLTAEQGGLTEEERVTAGQGASIAKFKRMVSMGRGGAARWAKYEEAMASGNGDALDAMRAAGIGGRFLDRAYKYYQKEGLEAYEMQRLNPAAWAKHADGIKEQARIASQVEGDMAKSMGELNAPFARAVLQRLMSGTGVGGEELSRLLTPFQNQGAAVQAQAGNIVAMQGNTTVATIAAVHANFGGMKPEAISALVALGGKGLDMSVEDIMEARTLGEKAGGWENAWRAGTISEETFKKYKDNAGAIWEASSGLRSMGYDTNAQVKKAYSGKMSLGKLANIASAQSVMDIVQKDYDLKLKDYAAKGFDGNIREFESDKNNQIQIAAIEGALGGRDALRDDKGHLDAAKIYKIVSGQDADATKKLADAKIDAGSVFRGIKGYDTYAHMRGTYDTALAANKDQLGGVLAQAEMMKNIKTIAETLGGDGLIKKLEDLVQGLNRAMN